MQKQAKKKGAVKVEAAKEIKPAEVVAPVVTEQIKDIDRALAETKPVATIKCPPLRVVGEYVGMTIKQVMEAEKDGKKVKDIIEIAEGYTLKVSHDGGKTYDAANLDYVIKANDVIEFGRASSTKGYVGKTLRQAVKAAGHFTLMVFRPRLVAFEPPLNYVIQKGDEIEIG